MFYYPLTIHANTKVLDLLQAWVFHPYTVPHIHGWVAVTDIQVSIDKWR